MSLLRPDAEAAAEEIDKFLSQLPRTRRGHEGHPAGSRLRLLVSFDNADPAFALLQKATDSASGATFGEGTRGR